MKVTRFIDRKLMRVVLGPVVRHVANALSLYLAGQGLSTGLINQLEAGVIAGATLAINVLFELRDQGNVAEKSARIASERAVKTTLDAYVPWATADHFDDVRARFDRESV